MSTDRNRSCATRTRVTLSLLAIFCAAEAYAGTAYGIFDARTLAMGGASVAIANNSNAQFYNAALLAFNDEIEEKTQDARFFFPMIVPQVSESGFNAEEILSDGLLSDLSQAVEDYNQILDPISAQAVVDASADLDNALSELTDEDLFTDVYVGLAISEPGKLQGAGFFLGTRLLVGGLTNISPDDRALLDDYREGLTFIASGGMQGVAHPELFDANGELLDPANDFDSTATAAGVAITEAGVGMSSKARLFGQPLAIGISFKAMRFDTFEDVERVTVDRIDVERSSETKATVNIDLSLAKEFGDHWRVGLAVKDVIPHTYETSLGTNIRLRPRPRIGAAYASGPLLLGLDVDVIENEVLGDEQPSQEAALGMEWTIAQALSLRGGYRHDILGNRDGILSAGVGAVWKRLAVDLAYAQGSDARAGAIQFGIAF